MNESKTHSQSEEKFRSLYEGMMDAFASVDMSGRIFEFNNAFKDMLGYSEEEIRDLTYIDLTPEKWHLIESKIIDEQVLTRGYSDIYEKEYRRKDGVIFPVELRTCLIRDDTGQPVAMWAIVRDITERRRSEERFAKLSRLKERLLAPGSLEGKLKLVTDGVVEILGADFARIWVVKEGDLCEKGCIHATATDDLHICRNRAHCLHLIVSSGCYTHVDGDHRRIPLDGYQMGRIITGGEPKFVTNDVTHDPHVHNHEWAKELGLVSSAGFQLLSQEGKPIGVLVLFSKQTISPDDEALLEDLADTTSHVIVTGLAEEALKSSEEKFRAVAEHAKAGIVLLQAERLIYANPYTIEYTGYPLDELVGALGASFMSPEYQSSVSAQLQKSMAGEALTSGDLKLITASGEEKWIQLSTASFEYMGRRTLVGIGLDITERKKAEEGMVELTRTLESRVAERTAQFEAANRELEAFTYSVSHDLRTPLRSIDGFSMALLEDYSEMLDVTAQDYLARVRTAAQRMAKLIDDLLRLSRITRAEMQYKTVNLSDMAHEILADLQEGDSQRDVEIIVEPAVEVIGDPNLLRVALENLLDNAWKFTGREPVGKIELGTACIDGEQAIFVRDNGAGFDMAYVEKLFKPFQRLHADSEFPGTGIGLAIVGRVIGRHGGRVWAVGEVNHGATFFFILFQ